MKKYVVIRYDNSNIIWNNIAQKMQRFGIKEGGYQLYFDSINEANAICDYLNEKDAERQQKKFKRKFKRHVK